MKQQISIRGMSCTGCASRIASTLQSDSHVTSAVIDFATQTGVVEGDISREQIGALVRKAGYEVFEPEVANGAKDASISRGIPPEIGRMIGASALALPVVVLAMGPWKVEHSPTIQALLTTMFLLGPASGFTKRAFKQLTHLTVTMDTLVSLGMLSAWASSLYLMTTHAHHLYFESAVMIGFFVLLGKTLEDRARKASIGEVDKLVRLRPRTAFVKNSEGTVSELPIASLALGMMVYVRPGDMLAVDGEVTEGEASFDESIITGESLPVVRRVGEAVVSGAVNAGATGVSVQVTKIGGDTTVEKIIRLMEDARLSRPPVQALADRISGVFVPVVMAIAVLTFLGWKFFGDKSFEDSLMIGLSVLVVACPCALGLATPVAWVAGLGQAAKGGILVRNYDALESLRKATAIVFDKTGTLTLGKPAVLNVLVGEGFSLDDDLPIIMSCLSHSSHPLSRAVAEWIRARGKMDTLPISKLLEEKAGAGVTCRIKKDADEIVIRYGRPDFVASASLVEKAWPSLVHSAHAIVASSIGGKPAFAFELDDALRPGVKEQLKALKDRGLKIFIASGDRSEVVDNLKKELEYIDHAYGLVKPESKKKIVEDLRSAGEKVAFVGDGINDAPAMAAADIALAMASGTDVAASTSGLVLQRAGIDTVMTAFILSEKITKIIHQNFFWAFFYNIAAIPIAMSGSMTPMWAAAAMAMSSLSVVTNALRLR